MDKSSLEFVMPGVIDAIPLIVIFLVLPIWLLVIVFKYSGFSKFKKVVFVPVCVVAPFIVSLAWPLAIKLSGIVGFTGPGEYDAPYTWYATELFGEFSEYVWATLTTIAVLVIHKLVKP